ncbi:hypothetical protein ma614 [Moumouvirus australiensis]|uniref:Uncharacterized protein n=1 Tax=Moumouvirus australiensis TaxID=2109587 RepID=A0A2P1EM92_9VIRU|nr:hypothetical protein QKC55_gp291 [Moumouvirus australiensis]AVL95000.1 hypothetical protein ma614 [Moumouvirus australiensis]
MYYTLTFDLNLLENAEEVKIFPLENICNMFFSENYLVEIIPISEIITKNSDLVVKKFSCGTTRYLYDLDTLKFFAKNGIMDIIYSCQYVSYLFSNIGFDLIDYLIDYWLVIKPNNQKKYNFINYLKFYYKDSIIRQLSKYPIPVDFIETKINNLSEIEYAFIFTILAYSNIYVANSSFLLLLDKFKNVVNINYLLDLLVILFVHKKISIIKYLITEDSEIPNLNVILKIVLLECDLDTIKYFNEIGVEFPIIDEELIDVIIEKNTNSFYLCQLEKFEKICPYFLNMKITLQAKSKIFDFMLQYSNISMFSTIKNSDLDIIKKTEFDIPYDNYLVIKTAIRYNHNNIAKYLIEIVNEQLNDKILKIFFDESIIYNLEMVIYFIKYYSIYPNIDDLSYVLRGFNFNDIKILNEYIFLIQISELSENDLNYLLKEAKKYDINGPLIDYFVNIGATY